MSEPVYFPRPADCGSGWRVCRHNKKGYLFQICDKRGRPITFRTFEGAQRRADEKNMSNEDFVRGKKAADTATLLMIPEKYRVTPTTDEASSISIAVAASIKSMLGALEEHYILTKNEDTDELYWKGGPGSDSDESDLDPGQPIVLNVNGWPVGTAVTARTPRSTT